MHSKSKPGELHGKIYRNLKVYFKIRGPGISKPMDSAQLKNNWELITVAEYI